MRSLPCISVCTVILLYACVHGATSTANNEISFNQSTYFTKEDGNFNLTLVLTSTKPVSNDVLVRINTTVDHDSSTESSALCNTTFPVNSSEANCNVLLSADDLPATLIIDIVPSNVNVTTGDIPYTTVEHIPKHVSFAEKNYKVNESDGSVFITLVLDSPSSSDIPVEVWEYGESASHKDYSPGPYHVTIPAGNTAKSFNISLYDDGILEENETIFLLISTSDVVMGGDNTEVMIIDTTVISVQFNESTYQFIESDGIDLQPVLVLNGSSAIDITVQVTNTDISDTIYSNDETGDYKYETLVTFEKGISIAPLNISIIDDELLEDDEIFNLTIDPSSLPSNVIVDKLGIATVTILNDDAVSVYFENSTYIVNENEGIVQVTLVLNISSSIDITVYLYNDNGLSAVPGKDYESENEYAVIFQSNIMKAKLNVSIINDKLLEYDENFTLNINSSSMPNNVYVGDPHNATVTILSDDSITICFNQRTYTATVGETVDIEVVLSEPLQAQSGALNVNVTFVSDEESHEGSQAYPITFENQSISQVIPVVVTQNGTVNFDFDTKPDYIKTDDLNSTASILATAAAATTPTPTATNAAGATTATAAAAATTTAAAAAATTTTAATTTPAATTAATVTTAAATTGGGDSTAAATTGGGDSTASGAFGFTSLFYVSIILLLVLIPTAYVYYQNREKIRGCLRGKRGGRHGRYHLLPSSVGEALRSSHKD